MSKPQIKKKELPTRLPPEQTGGEVSTPMAEMTAKDLSLEKRIELYQEAFDAFKKYAATEFGLTLDIELAGMPRAIIPRMIVVDLLKQPNVPTQTPTNKTTQDNPTQA